MWVVMTSTAAMPQSCTGNYRRVALVQLDQYMTARNLRPKMISSHAKGVVRIVDYGPQNVGKTPRAAYQRTVAAAEAEAHRRNNIPCNADTDLLTSWGGSA